jgi:2-polyprenyl-3-methyl-5-hydroxy-6-metoxy-1,4-benzoquinol methylase
LTDTAITSEARNYPERFAFGENWRRFLSVVDESRVNSAQRSLEDMLGTGTLAGKSFVDVGCGSGLFSLAAVRLGAARVQSFDVDEASVACARELKRRFAEHNERWEIGPGSILDDAFIAGLGLWDIVYSWGVLHHTGDMWRALGNVESLVGPRGALFVSIYNDQGLRSRVWRRIKRRYNRLPLSLRTPYAIAAMLPREVLSAGAATAAGRPGDYVRSWTGDRKRGMSRWHDLLDWVGGYPFEVARPEQVFDFFRDRGFSLTRLRTSGGGLGCNEFVFVRATDGEPRIR